MRIALVTHQFFPRYYTGVERLTLNLAGQLQRMGHRTSVLTPASHASGGTAAYAFGGVDVRPVSGTPDLERPWRAPERVERSLGIALDDGAYDLVHVMQPLRLPSVFDEAATRGLPVVAHVPDFSYTCARIVLRRPDGSRCPTAAGGAACRDACGVATAPRRLEWGRAALAGATAVVSPTRYAIARHARDGFDTAHWHHVPWGVDYALHPSRLPPPRNGELVIGFLGTLLRHKGPDVVIDAVRQLPDAAVELRLYGDSFHEGDYEDELRAAAEGDARISFRGAYDHGALRSILAQLDAVVVPSLWDENLPSTALNAIAAGVPVVASAVPGLEELVEDYRAGVTFPAGDADALARLLLELAARPERSEALRAALLHPPGVEEEAWRIERLYTDILRGRAR
jgi:glycosyltransferase involved in cell wall biosynthesis